MHWMLSMNVVKMSSPRAVGASLLVLIGSLPTSAQQPQTPSTAHDDSILQRRYDAAAAGRDRGVAVHGHHHVG